MKRLALGLALAALVAGGCGGDRREKAVENAETWLRAVGDLDTDVACDLMRESAVDALRQRSGLGSGANCVGVVRAYGRSFKPGAIDGVLKVGLEAEGTAKEGELGVFPISGPRELQVILMRESEDGWKVASTSLGPTEPRPTATPRSKR